MTATPRTAGDGAGSAAGAARARPAQGVLVIGGSAFADSVRQVLSDEGLTTPVRDVADYLMALGDVAQQPPAVVLGRVDGLEESLEPMVRGIRRLLPTSRLLLVVATSEEPVAIQAVRAGFNDYLIEPIDTQELARQVRIGLEPEARPRGDRGFRFPGAGVGAVQEGPSAAPVPSVVGRLSEPSVPTRRDGSETRPTSVPAMTGEIAAPAPASPPASLSPTEPVTPGAKAAAATCVAPALRLASAAPPPMANVPEGDLGDIDLIARIIGDPEGLGDLALRLIAGRSGIAGLGWLGPEAAPPENQAAARVVFEGTPLGFLCAPAPARGEDLAPWASWLGHWVALDRRLKDLREAALRDELTGVWNRRYFRHFLASVLERAAEERFCVTLMVFDIDDFKSYNDRFGHAAGDEILREAGRLMQSVVRTHDVVARIGGDEFAVIFWDAEEPRRPNSRHPQTVRRAARRFQRAILSHQFPKLLSEAPGRLTISGGLAGFPWDGRNPDDLLAFADARAMESKRQGKNALTFGPGAAGEEEEEEGTEGLRD